MGHPEFYRNLGPFSLKQIANYINAELECKDEDFLINDFNGIESSKATDITFLNDNYNHEIDSMDVKS